MPSNLLRIQKMLLYVCMGLVAALFVLYLGFMTQYFVLFFDGTMETFEFYKQLQVFNKEAFSIALWFIVVVALLYAFGLARYRPGLGSLLATVGATAVIISRSMALLGVLPVYKRGYLALDFEPMEDYVPTTFVFDTAVTMHYLLIGAFVLLTLVALASFSQRLREGKPLVRKLL